MIYGIDAAEYNNYHYVNIGRLPTTYLLIHTSEMPFFLISQDLLIFKNLNGQRKIFNFNQKLERFSKLLWFQC